MYYSVARHLRGVETGATHPDAERRMIGARSRVSADSDVPRMCIRVAAVASGDAARYLVFAAHISDETCNTMQKLLTAKGTLQCSVLRREQRGPVCFCPSIHPSTCLPPPLSLQLVRGQGRKTISPATHTGGGKAAHRIQRHSTVPRDWLPSTAFSLPNLEPV